MSVRKALAVFCLMALAAGCRDADAPRAADAVAGTPWISHVCEDGRRVQLLYPDARTARLKLAGEIHEMRLVISASGARYAGDGLQWWIKGETGMLAPLASGEEIAAAPGVRCGPVGALEAASLIETYYALVASGRSAEAAALREDGVVEDVRPFATLAAQVGPPGRVEGAAGSLYVETPVVVYGRYDAGGDFMKSGKVVLRRSNDVPGASAAERTWRISRIELE